MRKTFDGDSNPESSEDMSAVLLFKLHGTKVIYFKRLVFTFN